MNPWEPSEGPPNWVRALFQALLISCTQRSINVMNENIIKDRVNIPGLAGSLSTYIAHLRWGRAMLASFCLLGELKHRELKELIQGRLSGSPALAFNHHLVGSPLVCDVGSEFPLGFPGSSDGEASAYQAGDPGWIHGLGRFSWRRKWQSTPVFMPGKSHGLRSLGGYSPWDRRESDTTEQLQLSSASLSCGSIKLNQIPIRWRDHSVQTPGVMGVGGSSYCPTLSPRAIGRKRRPSDTLSPPLRLTQPSPRVPGRAGLSGFPKLWLGAEKLQGPSPTPRGSIFTLWGEGEGKGGCLGWAVQT